MALLPVCAIVADAALKSVLFVAFYSCRFMTFGAYGQNPRTATEATPRSRT